MALVKVYSIFIFPGFNSLDKNTLSIDLIISAVPCGEMRLEIKALIAGPKIKTEYRPKTVLYLACSRTKCSKKTSIHASKIRRLMNENAYFLNFERPENLHEINSSFAMR